ncbi:hypothetical protein K1T71_013369, partial [Dendrolimus kikuchii]
KGKKLVEIKQNRLTIDKPICVIFPFDKSWYMGVGPRLAIKIATYFLRHLKSRARCYVPAP